MPSNDVGIIAFFQSSRAYPLGEQLMVKITALCTLVRELAETSKLFPNLPLSPTVIWK